MNRSIFYFFYNKVQIKRFRVKIIIYNRVINFPQWVRLYLNLLCWNQKLIHKINLNKSNSNQSYKYIKKKIVKDKIGSQSKKMLPIIYLPIL